MGNKIHRRPPIYRLINSLFHTERRGPVEDFSDFAAVNAKGSKQAI